MPPEPLPFDRKDFLKDRRSSSSDAIEIVPQRWRGPTTTPSQYRNHGSSLSCRWGSAGGPSDFRRPYSGNKENSVSMAFDSQKGGNFWETATSPNGNSFPHTDSSVHLQSVDQHAKNIGGGGFSTTNSQRLDKETSIDWKPLKWIRSGSLTSRGSGFSHSSGCKIIGVDSFNNNTSLGSPSDDSATCLTPRTPDDATSRKKQRLGWGEGLAKYEKKKVDPESDDVVDKETLLISPSNLSDKSPSVNYLECSSPTTPYSFACSSSPGVEEKETTKTVTVDNRSLVDERMQTDDSSSEFVKVDKLEVKKAEVTKTLEITETEIDSLENELKSMVCNESKNKTFEEKTDSSPEEVNGVEDSCDKSPGTTSEFVEVGPVEDHGIDVSTGSICTDSDCEVVNDVTKVDKVFDVIMENNVIANEASDELGKILPTTNVCANKSKATDESLIKERFEMRKRFLKLKERVITSKFRALHYSWKEDLSLLSIKKSTKSHKKFESSSRMGYVHSQKSCSSGGNLSLVPTSETLDYVKKLMSDSKVKVHRDTMKMPSLILDRTERRMKKFISDNSLVENPIEIEKERSIVNAWKEEEKKIFLQKYSLLGKDFKKIASFLEKRTVGDCVEYYYKNHKSDSFENAKKMLKFAKGKSCNIATNTTYMVTTGKRLNNNVGSGGGGVTSLDMLANVDSSQETAAADVLAGICGSISSEALSSCITSLVDSPDVYNHNKLGGGYSSRRQVAARGDADVETCSDDSCGGEIEMMNHADWTDGEKSCFIQAVRNYGKDFTMISKSMKTRSRDECKVYYSKGRKCLGLDEIHVDGKAGPDHEYDNDDGHDDTCMVDSGSVISCDKSSSEIKMEVEDLHSSDSKQEVVESEQITVNVCEPTGEEAPQTEKVDTLDLSNNSVNNNNGFQAIRDSPIHRKTHSQDDISSRLSFRKSGGFQRSSSTDGYHLHLPKHSLMDCVESSSHVLRVPSLQICTTTLSKKQPSDVGEKSGDVKLFGQILTKPKSNRTGGLQESVEKSLHLGLSEVPLRRSYGFWDGNRIQTGFPDSSILLAKYPSAYGNNGVSDPVAAIRMHYAKTEQYNNGSSGAV